MCSFYVDICVDPSKHLNLLAWRIPKTPLHFIIIVSFTILAAPLWMYS